MTTIGPDAGDIEWLDVGPPDRDSSLRRPPDRRWWLAALAGLLVLIAGAIALTSHHSHKHVAAPPSAPTQPPASHQQPVSVPLGPVVVAQTPAAALGSPRVTSVGHALLGETQQWELFLRGPQTVTRVQLAAGRVSVTSVPDFNSGGDVAFLVDANRVLTRPSSFVSGYEVADGQPATNLAGALVGGGPAFPGPAPDQYWAQSGNADGNTLHLVDPQGRLLGPTITLPSTLGNPIIGDGSGYVIAQGVGGSYDARPGSLRRITTGQVIAVGPTAWLAEECDDVGSCSDIEIDQATWTRQVIGPTTSPIGSQPGVISPDGLRAVIIRPNQVTRTLQVIDIATGAVHTLMTIPDTTFGDEIVAWSPDDRWLFAIGGGGSLHVFNTTSLREVPFGVTVPPTVQIAIRPAP